nr:nucleotide-binding alpha-beta plait domain-containing protein [Tanacetum cinerariifolium]
MGSQRSKEDEVFKISTSVFVTNFPDQINAKELWNTCKQYGFVVDAIIPTRRSKAGKRFGFVRFINVSDAELLVNNLCTIWIRRYKIHANTAWFQQAPMNNSSSQFKNNEAKRNYTYTDAKGHANSYLHDVKGFLKPNLRNDSNPVLVLDGSCLNQQDYSYCLLGKVKEFSSLSNLKTVLVCEGFENVKIRYLGGFWVMFEFTTKEVKKKFQSCTTISSWFSQIQQATCDFTTDGRVSWVEIEGIPLKMWSENTFKRITSKWGVLIHVDDQEDSVFHCKRICIRTTTQLIISESFRITYKGKSYWIHAKEVPGWVPDFVEDTDDGDESDDDDDDDDEGESKGVMLGDSDVEAVPDIMFEEVLPNANEGDAPSVGNKEMHSDDPFNIYDLLKVKKVPSADSLKYHPGFTPNDDIEDGEVQSAKRKDSIQEKDEGIQNIPEDDVSSEVRKSNLKMHDKENGTDSACSGHFKKSDIPYFDGSILLVMDELLKVGQTMGYNMEGCMKNIEKIIDVCSSRANQKKMLWDYLSLVITNWKGEVIIMGDFNEVRNKTERFGSVFNAQGANAFNAFISSSGLAKVPLGGCSFTWCHKSATKMSKLDRFLISESLMSSCPNISAISLDRFLSDHRPILLREFMLDYGSTPFRFFHYWIEVDGFLKMVKDTWNVALDEKLHSMKVAQKAKIQWAIEGDENSKFYHDRLYVNMEFPRKLSSTQQADLEIDVSNEEIKKVVWDYGIDKSLSLDGFTFGFYRHFWKLIEKDGHPLSPFLFIIIMEILHISFQRVVDAVHVLDCFYRASGLRINMCKSKLMGISVGEERVNQAASKIGCLALKVPFSYLGTKVGGIMSRIHSWKEIINSMVVCLSKWKMKTLSIGGRLTLLKSVLGSKPIFYMSIFKVPMKFTTQRSSLWARVIKAIHEDDGKMGNGEETVFWDEIWCDNEAFKYRYPRLYALETCKSIDVAAKFVHTSIDHSFRHCPRSDVEQTQLSDLRSKLAAVSLVDGRDKWKWSLEGSGGFSVSLIRKLIDDKRLLDVSFKTRWNKVVLIKINIHA